MIVVDTNVIAYLFISGELTLHAKNLLRKEPVWLAPILWRSEFRNVLSFYIHQNELSLINAIDLISEAENMMQGNEFEVRSKKVLELAEKSKCSAYDCEFISLSIDLNLKLVSSDKKLIKKFNNVVIPLNKF